MKMVPIFRKRILTIMAVLVIGKEKDIANLLQDLKHFEKKQKVIIFYF